MKIEFVSIHSILERVHVGGRLMRKLDETVLELCDIVLTSDSGITSRVVRKHTDSDISHAMLYVQNHSLIDSTGDGVHASNTQRNLFADDSSVYVLRTRAPLTDLQKQSIVECPF